MAQQNQLSKPTFTGLPADFLIHYSQLIDTINSLQGYSGVIKLNNHIDLGGSQIKNVGAPTDPADAITQGVAEASYSAPVLAPKLEATGSNPLKSIRRLGDPNQRESNSSWLNDLMSTPPSANAIYPLLSNVTGGVQVIIPASPFTFADGSTLILQSRTDVLSLPTSYTISTISCTSNLVTVQTTASISVSRGQVVTVTGVSPSGFNGVWEVTSYTPPNEFTYQDFLGTVVGSGGTVELGNTYYYTVKKRSTVVNLIGPLSGDNATNRLNACFDGSQIVAVIGLTASGGIVSQTGGGGSPILGSPSAGCFF